jgi:hypothetical protein
MMHIIMSVCLRCAATYTVAAAGRCSLLQCEGCSSRGVAAGVEREKLAYVGSTALVVHVELLFPSSADVHVNTLRLQ